MIASYNIHRAKGTDGVRDISRIAAVLRNADFAGLFEVEGPMPLVQQDQAAQLGEQLNAAWLYAPVQHRWLRYNRGNGFVTRLPVTRWYQEPLPDSTGTHPRCLVTAWVKMDDVEIPLLMAHLARRKDQVIQLKTVFDRFLRHERAILMGDFNITRDHPLMEELLDSGKAIDANARACSDAVDRERVDWILVRGLEVRATTYCPEGASDHPCFSVSVAVPGASTRPLNTRVGAPALSIAGS